MVGPGAVLTRCDAFLHREYLSTVWVVEAHEASNDVRRLHEGSHTMANFFDFIFGDGKEPDGYRDLGRKHECNAEDDSECDYYYDRETGGRD